jgi:hypothetical protein
LAAAFFEPFVAVVVRAAALLSALSCALFVLLVALDFDVSASTA